jgi:hypothetical protein
LQKGKKRIMDESKRLVVQQLSKKPNMRWLICGLSLLVLLVSFSPFTHADPALYVLEGLKWNQLTVDFWCNPLGVPAPLTAADFSNALQFASTTWNGASNGIFLNFKGCLVGAGETLHLCTNHGDGFNVLGWANMTWSPQGSSVPVAKDVNHGGANGGLALSTLQFAGGILAEADTCFNALTPWSVAPVTPAGSFDLYTTALHEFGHWLDLDDLSAANCPIGVPIRQTCPGQIMWWSQTSDTIDQTSNHRFLGDGDSEGVVAAYPSLASVGGVAVGVDKLALLAPFVGLASLIVAAATVTAVYATRARHREEKQ